MKHGKLRIGDKIDHLTIEGSRRAGSGAELYVIWICRCECGLIRETRTSVLRMERRHPLSCGCKGHGRKKPRLQLREKHRDPTRLEIAEECLQIHNDAGRQPPIELMANLRLLRRGNQ